MSIAASKGNSEPTQPAIPQFSQILGHPKPLWMLFMSEFWERFAFYGIRWAMVLYIVAQFYQGDSAGERPASELYGAYLALVYAGAIFGGYVADKLIGYQRSMMVGAVIMAAGLFMIAIPNEVIFRIGLATIIVGNGQFKPIISTMVGKLYTAADERRDSGFTIFYMGINVGAMIAPIITQVLAQKIFGTDGIPAYKVVFIAAGIGMLISLLWFQLGKNQLKGIGVATEEQKSTKRLLMVIASGLVVGVPLFYFLLSVQATVLQFILMALFIVPSVMLISEGIRENKVARDKVIAMLIIFMFNVLFWMFFEQAGSSFNFLADRIVNRNLGSWEFPTAWFQSVNSVAIITLAPVLAWLWVRLGKNNPSIPRKFGLGLLFNGLAFLLLVFALKTMVSDAGKIPFWTLFMVYVIQSIGELCLSPIGLSMTTKLAPARLGGLAMGCWFLSIAIGNNLSGIFAGHVSGAEGMTVDSAQAGYNFGFYALVGAGVLMFLVAPFVRKLMHGVK
ncbi:MAG: MFS transporter [Saprospiraceae bacterium]|nr:MFS transporter [Saprospiraceae bacterium]